MERVLSYLRKNPTIRGLTRPGPITLFKALYLRNRVSDRQAVFFGEYHLDVKVVWHGYHIASVPIMARGACQTWGTLDDPQNTLSQLLHMHNGWTDWAETSYTARHSTDNSCMWVIFGVLQHVRTCTPRFYISGTAEPIAPRFGM